MLKRINLWMLIGVLIFGILVGCFVGTNNPSNRQSASPLSEPDPTPTAPLLTPPTPTVYERIAYLFAPPVITKDTTTEPTEEPLPTETEPVHNHSFNKTVVAATPAYRGYTLYRCNCGETYRDHYTKRTLTTVTNSVYSADEIPQNMRNSDVLKALEYLGVNVQKLKDNGVLYRLDSIGSKTPNYAQSPVPYSKNGNGSGQQTIEDSSTPTGLAPDLSTFRKTGLDCVDFAAYYLTNYLPNIKGADISILEAMEEKYSDYYGRCYDHMDFWPKACADLAKQGLIEAYTYDVGEDYTDVFSKISPGTLIQMGTQKDPTRHYAIYAGSYNGNHYIIHSGNPNRGPEISLITYLWGDSSEDRDAWPVAFYEFHFPTA